MSRSTSRSAPLPDDSCDAPLPSALLQRALDELEAMVVIGDAQGREVFRNRAAMALLGARHGDALIAAALADALNADGEGGYRRELDLLGPPRRRLVIRGETLTDDGEAIGRLALAHDISEQAKVVDVRRDFVANVSHELRTPVGGLVSLADALEEETDRAVIDRLVHRIRAEAQRLATLIDDLLSLSRIEAEGSGQRRRIPVDELIAAAVERVAGSADAADIKVVVGQGADAVVRGDRDQLLSALTNLLENAVKYSNPGGQVGVTAVEDRHWVDIAVSDEGIGIPAEDLDRIFERFYRVDPARSRRTGGTGLGLAIVRHVAANHGGEVLVASQEGSGSTFTLRLPRGERSSR